jgi:hypothetical protein
MKKRREILLARQGATANLTPFTKMKPVSVICLQRVRALHMISLKPVSVAVFAENNAE